MTAVAGPPSALAAAADQLTAWAVDVVAPTVVLLGERAPAAVADVGRLLAERGPLVVAAAVRAGLLDPADAPALAAALADPSVRATVMVPTLTPPAAVPEPSATPEPVDAPDGDVGPAAPVASAGPAGSSIEHAVAAALERERRTSTRAAQRAAAKLSEVAARRDQWKARFEHSQRELDTEKERVESETERANAAERELRNALEAAERAARRIASPAGAAAALLDAVTDRFTDPREAELVRAGELADPVADAVASAGLDVDTLVSVLRAIVSPPVPVVEVKERTLRVTPLGGGTEIGGSCILVEAGSTRFLIDAGIRPNGATPAEQGPPGIDQALAGRLDAVVVTHAHNDHAGFIPALVASRGPLPVIASPGTAALLPTMWTDAAKVYARRSEDESRFGLNRDVLYDSAAVVAARGCVTEVAYGVVHRVADVTVELFPAGHIVGAAGVVVTAGAERLVVTGDIAGFAQASVGGYVLPDSARAADLMLVETTYCDGRHSGREDEVSRLVRTVADVVSGGGRVLVPAFALGRAQEVALSLTQHLPDVPVLVDGLARDVSAVVEATGVPVFTGKVTRVRSTWDSVRSFKSGVIIATSGMLTAGPALTWAREVLPDPGSALLLCGYQDEESPGRALMDLMESIGPRSLGLPDRDGRLVDVDVLARVDKFGLSAHADRDGLLRLVDEVAPAEVMLVHGYPGKQRRFAEVLGMHGHAVVPTATWGAGT